MNTQTIDALQSDLDAAKGAFTSFLNGQISTDKRISAIHSEYSDMRSNLWVKPRGCSEATFRAAIAECEELELQVLDASPEHNRLATVQRVANDALRNATWIVTQAANKAAKAALAKAEAEFVGPLQRMSKCCSCAAVVISVNTLPFFEDRISKGRQDGHYCGCRGWD